MVGGVEQGKLIAGLAGEEWLRWVAVDVTVPLAQATRLRDLAPVAATALGRALSGVALLYRHALRTPSRLQLSILGDGPLGAVVAEISSDRFRGRVGAPHLSNQHFGDRSRRLGEAIGSGRLEVVRQGQRGEFRSHSDLVTGEIGSDLAHYLLQSEQTRSAISVGEVLTSEGVAAAGGFLIEALPGTPEKVVSRLETNLAVVSSWSESLVASGLQGALEGVLTGLDPSVREEAPLDYRCGCDRETVLARLQSLPEVDRLELDQGRELSALCEYCGAAHSFESSDLAPSTEDPGTAVSDVQ